MLAPKKHRHRFSNKFNVLVNGDTRNVNQLDNALLSKALASSPDSSHHGPAGVRTLDSSERASILAVMCRIIGSDQINESGRVGEMLMRRKGSGLERAPSKVWKFWASPETRAGREQAPKNGASDEPRLNHHQLRRHLQNFPSKLSLLYSCTRDNPPLLVHFFLFVSRLALACYCAPLCTT